MLIDSPKLLEFIQSKSFSLTIDTLQINTSAFYNAWFQNMRFLTTKNICKLNCLTIIHVMDTLDQSILFPNFNLLLTSALPEVERYITEKQNPQPEK